MTHKIPSILVTLLSLITLFQASAYAGQGVERTATLLNADGSLGETITYIDYDGEAVLGGDILIHVDGPYAALDQRHLDPAYWRSQSEKSAGHTSATNLWPGNLVVYTIDSDLTSTQVTWINQAISAFETWTNLRFLERTDETAYVRFRYPDYDSCSANVGYQGSEQFINIGGCWDKASVIHEIGHAVGLFHEHTRADRDEYVEIVWSRIESDSISNFYQYTATDGSDLGEYDYFSVMHYGCWAASDNGKKTIQPIVTTLFDGCNEIGEGDGLSDGDVEGLAMLYPDLVTIDNTEDHGSGYTEGFTTFGSWTSSTSTSGYLLSDYLVTAAGSGAAAMWNFDVPRDGFYEVRARWTSGGNRSAAASYSFSWWDGNMQATVLADIGSATVDQRYNGGTDNLLGQYYLSAGDWDVAQFYVFVESSTDGYVVADAVTLEYVGAADEIVAMNWATNAKGETLFALDAASAVSEDIGAISGDHTCVSDLDFQPSTGILYAVNCDDYAGTGNTLMTIDEETGEATTIGTLAGDRTLATSIAFHPDEPDVIYAINRNGNNWGTVLYTIDVTTGTTTDIGTLWGDRTHATSIAFDPDGVLYAINNSYTGGSGEVLYTIDTSTAETTQIGWLSGDRTHATSIRFDTDGNLYGINWNDYWGTGRVLYTIDPSTAVATDIGWLSGDRTYVTSFALRK